MSSDNCRAKDPTKCRHHGNDHSGNSFVAKMKNALKSLSFTDYEEGRKEAENTTLDAPLPVSERPTVSMEDAYNAVRANYGSVGYKDMSEVTRDVLARDEMARLNSAAVYMPAGVVTPEAIEAYIAEQRSQSQRQGTWIEDDNESDKRISRIAAKHVLSNAFKPTNNSIAVEEVKMNSLPATEEAAIRQAESKAEAENQAILAEETERTRLTDTRAICNIMWNNRHNAAEHVTEHLNGKEHSFTETEKATLLQVAKNINPDNPDHRATTKALEFLTTTSRLHKTMQSGYYFDNLPVTELLKRYEAK